MAEQADGDRLAEIAQREQMATPGPWYYSRPAVHGRVKTCEDRAFVMESGSYGVRYDEDGEFIAHSRSDVPWLLAEVSRLTAERDAAKCDVLLLLSALNGLSPDLLNTPKRNSAGESILSVQQHIAIARADIGSWLNHHEETCDERDAALRENERLKAEVIARKAHAGQRDTVTGVPYIQHVERVVERVPDYAKAAAWLHDVIEDSEWTAEQLEKAGISEAVVESVILLTRTARYDYASYIELIATSDNDVARIVKLADLGDHLHANCPDRLRPRYEAAQRRLCE